MGLILSCYFKETDIDDVDEIIIVKFPVDFSLQIFSLWLRIDDLTRVDTACCNRMNRITLLKLLSNQFLILRHGHVGVNGLKWRLVFLRAIKVGSLKISNLCYYPKGSLVFPVNMSGVLKLHLLSYVNMSHINLSQLISSCEQVEELWLENVENFDDDTLLSIRQSSIRKLRIFCAARCTPQLSSISVNHLSEHCYDLVVLNLKLSGMNDVQYETSFISLLKANRKLEFVCLMFTHQIISENLLTSISSYCPMICDVCLGNCQHISLSLIQQFILKHEKTLYNFQLQFGGDLCNYFKYYGRVGEFISAKLLVIRKFKMLQNLARFLEDIVNFDTISIHTADTPIDTEIINAIIKHNPNVKEIHLINCGPTSIEYLKMIFEKCTKLVSLELSASPYFNNEDFKSLFTTPNNVTYLNMSFHDTLDLDTVMHILTNNPQIKTIRCRHCRKFSTELLAEYLIMTGLIHVKLCAIECKNEVAVTDHY